MKTLFFKKLFNIPAVYLQNFEFDTNFVSLPADTKASIFANIYNHYNSKISIEDANKWYAAMANEKVDLRIYTKKRYLTVTEFIEIMFNREHFDISFSLRNQY